MKFIYFTIYQLHNNIYMKKLFFTMTTIINDRRKTKLCFHTIDKFNCVKTTNRMTSIIYMCNN